MIPEQVLHLAARILLRTCQPLTAHAVLTRVGRWLPQRRTREDVSRAAGVLAARGTCLSRVLALAATAPAADVVIGVRNLADSAAGSYAAHAWLEIEGRPLVEGHPLHREIARLPGAQSLAVRP